MAKINLAHIIENTEVEGPGKRFALWVQGCQRQCPGCCNPDLFDLIPKTIVESEKICDAILKSQQQNGIEGVTFLGGEPMLQAKGLSEIAHFCHEHHLSVMVFTGYTREELEAEGLPFVDQLLRDTDLLVDGSFDQAHPETKRNWVGSTNQRFHFFTDLYPNGIEYDQRFSHGFELRIHPNSTIQANGFPWHNATASDNGSFQQSIHNEVQHGTHSI